MARCPIVQFIDLLPIFYLSLARLHRRQRPRETRAPAFSESRIMFSQADVGRCFAEMRLNEPVENGAAVTLEELRTHHCRWPLGAVHAKPPFLYCGARA